MAQAVVNFRIDADLKQNIEQICHEMGMSLTTAFTIFAKTLDRERRIPFEVKADIPNEITLDAIEAAENDEMYGPFETVDELMEALNA